MKIRIKFEKRGAMKFIGHLDTMRYFQRAIRRAGIDIAYTEGYSPHPVMSFALPLGVGTESVGEYFDIQVHSSLSSQEAINALNAQMCDGFLISGYKMLPDDAKKAMSIVEAADYSLRFREGYELQGNWQDKLFKFYEQPEIFILKQTKKSERELNIKPLLFDLKLLKPEQENESMKLYLRLKAGSVNNLKPQLVMSAFYKTMGIPLSDLAIEIMRLDLLAFSKEQDRLISLGEFGESI